MSIVSAADKPESQGAPHRIVIAPNCSLSGHQALGFFVAVAGVSLAVALLFTLQGYWPILPFAGAEIFLLGWALGSSQRRGRYREVITVGATEVTVEKGYAQGEFEQVFDRPWVRARLEKSAWRECRVVLSSHGKHTEVGACLNYEERKALYTRLGQVLADTP